MQETLIIENNGLKEKILELETKQKLQESNYKQLSRLQGEQKDFYERIVREKEETDNTLIKKIRKGNTKEINDRLRKYYQQKYN